DRHEAGRRPRTRRPRDRPHRGGRGARAPLRRRGGDRDRRHRRPRAHLRPAARGRPRRRPGGPDHQALQARLQPVQARRALRVGDRRSEGRRRALRADRGPVHRREPRPAAARRRPGARGWRDDAARRRLQAAHQPVRVPRSRRRGAQTAAGGQGSHRAADRHGVHGRPRPRGGRRGRRHDPARCAEHAELHAADRDRALRRARDDQARVLLHPGGAADGRRVRPQGGQREGAALRARHPHLRDGLPLHAGPHRGSGAQGAVAPAGHRGSLARGGPPRPRRAAVPGRCRGRRRRHRRRGPSGARSRRLRRPAAAARRGVRRLRPQGRAGRRPGGQGAERGRSL
ncbi:MAG: 2-keto-3-deoxy-D-arabino-heptulosonate-7-phosphate synthase I beta, partial [uncultured Solirubrobacteraceae bacterium]